MCVGSWSQGVACDVCTSGVTREVNLLVKIAPAPETSGYGEGQPWVKQLLRELEQISGPF